jgi:hypothetical protein
MSDHQKEIAFAGVPAEMFLFTGASSRSIIREYRFTRCGKNATDA